MSRRDAASGVGCRGAVSGRATPHALRFCAAFHTLLFPSLTQSDMAPRSYTGEYNGGSMSGLGVYKWANGRHATCVDSAASFAYLAPVLSLAQHLQGRMEGTPKRPQCAGLAGTLTRRAQNNNQHGCGKKWYPGGAIEEVRLRCCNSAAACVR